MAVKKGLIGNSSAFLEMMESVSRFARHQRSVLVVGERGTGKEAIADRLHYLSPRWQQQLVKVNCAAFSDELLDSELFGYEAGAFTGAQRKRDGLFHAASGGTLFLDELATMGSKLQEKLLRVIEYGEYYRVGGSETVTVDVRVVAATNEDLPGLARQGKFRHDLLDRLAFDVLALPPLRFRDEDILRLASHFAFAMASELGWESFAGFSVQAQQALNDYQWPGNVRELKNVVERSVCRQEALGNNQENQLLNLVVFDPFDSPWLSGLSGLSVDFDQLDMTQDTPNMPLDLQLENKTLGEVEKLQHLLEQKQAIDLKSCLSKIEKQLIETALLTNHRQQQKTAEQLQLSYDQLRARIKKYSKESHIPAI
ncbi:phage shock protein operon transcriptional activator [Pelagibaculum spongiae]|uniref:Phage shock protein operon transcriptional activator n=1 Tax=Pelagibaculum spongiae TaxID=2080658 RepID=A0A2V1GZ86_9GAMM|nr:phage shock protein operon transcriptional activator [Pelagibaculum spongiae]PVZ70274.1 phage shock protein operon transcriptional activator [Pelagibaculum spongiae]